MNDQTAPPVLPDPPDPRLTRRLGTIVRLFLFGLAALAALTALFYAVENWRGQRAWDNHRRTLEARGERLDLAAFVPPPVPDEENFAATPFLATIFVGRPSPANVSHLWPTDFEEAEKQLQKIRKSTRQTSDAPAGLRQPTDLLMWQSAFARAQGEESETASAASTPGERAKAAAAVLEALKVYDPLLEELRAASTRPHSRYDVRYDEENPFGILLPHLAVVRRTCSVLKLRAIAALVAGQTNQAFQDLKLMLRLDDSIASEPFIISALVQHVCQQWSVDVLWEGLREGRWSEAHLVELGSHFQSYDHLGRMVRSLGAERAAALSTIDSIRRNPGRLRAIVGDESGGHESTGLLMRLAPRGWFYLEQLNYSRLMGEVFSAGSDAGAKRVQPSRSKEGDRNLQRICAEPAGAVFHHRFFARLLLPALTASLTKAARAQTLADQAALACALERARRAQGQFPERLEALVPQFMAALPQDVITGGLPNYRRLATGGIEIYSVGWDETDDGGQPEARRGTGDWVWHQPSPK